MSHRHLFPVVLSLALCFVLSPVASLFQLSSSPFQLTAAEPENLISDVDDSGNEICTSSITKMIDEHIRRRWNEKQIKPANRSSDELFVRRVYLDLAGVVPTSAQREAFLADTSTEKRKKLISRLLDSEDHVQHFTDLFDAILMGRVDESKYQKRRQHLWRSYLEEVFRANRPWNQVAREILLARPGGQSDDKTHDGSVKAGAVWFLYERENDHQAIAEAVAPAFFGIRIECAQCHDHMMADEIKQAHYWGLVAFFNRSKNETTKSGPRMGESAIGGFSEFANLSGDSSPNLLTFFDATTVDEPRPKNDVKQEDSDGLYESTPADGDLRVPKFSRREKFVTEILDEHPLLATAMVNRIWAIMMSRGIVHPYDEIDSMHRPSHPELLEWLAEDFRENGHNIRRLVEGIANTQAYQLDSVKPNGVEDPATFAWYLERPLTAEQYARSIQQVARGKFENNHAIVANLRDKLTDVLPDETIVTISDAMFLTNNQGINRFIDESTETEHLIGNALALNSPREQAALLIKTVFGRDAVEDEVLAIERYVADRNDRSADALTQILWSLVTSAEFRFNH